MKLVVLTIIITTTSSLQVYKSRKEHPKVIVFDLDNTLWPSWHANKIVPPFLLEELSKDVIDDKSNVVTPFKDVLAMLTLSRYNNISLAIASNNTEPKHANQLIKLFSWDQFFMNKQIYSGPIKTHLKTIKEEYDIKFDDMLFFSSNQINVFVGNRLNILSFLSKKGMSMKIFMKGITRFVKLKRIALNIPPEQYKLKKINDESTLLW